MSARPLYRKLPESQRFCSYYQCRNPVKASPAWEKGQLYHNGCKADALEEHFECLDCFGKFDATEAAFVEVNSSVSDVFRQRLKPICPFCGSGNLKRGWS